MRLKMPFGISNYEELIRDGYYYVDKTKYIEKLENLPEKRIMFLRPRKFGKTLFTSVIENYYDKNKADEFELLFKNTYIGKNPTKNKNRYCILRFNFSGIDTSSEEAPITLDSLTSGFNIGTDITQDIDFNDMMGFTQNELIDILNNQGVSKEEQEEILPIMKENYDGYKFSLNAENRIYNSNMCLYFLSRYIRLKEIPNDLIDMNIASDYSKIGKMLDLCKGEKRLDILRKTVQGETITNTLVEKFNPAIEFTEIDMISMLYYLGYLTISGELIGIPELAIPNNVMKEIYKDNYEQRR